MCPACSSELSLEQQHALSVCPNGPLFLSSRLPPPLRETSQLPATPSSSIRSSSSTPLSTPARAGSSNGPTTPVVLRAAASGFGSGEPCSTPARVPAAAAAGFKEEPSTPRHCIMPRVPRACPGAPKPTVPITPAGPRVPLSPLLPRAAPAAAFVPLCEPAWGGLLLLHDNNTHNMDTSDPSATSIPSILEDALFLEMALEAPYLSPVERLLPPQPMAEPEGNNNHNNNNDAPTDPDQQGNIAAAA